MKHATLAGFSCWCPIAIALILLGLLEPLRASPPIQTTTQNQIMGTVTDSSGEPLGGVNIIVSGKGQGTISDFDGTYSITASPQDTLVYSFVGFKTWKERVGEQLAINVVLHEDVTALNEVTVNAGYYTVKEREHTGSISRITSKDIEKQPVSNPLAAMQGRMSGVDIRQSTGVPGGGFSVQIRGQNSISSGNDPLYIVDGVPFTSESVGSLNTGIMPVTASPLTVINPSDIESIEVLKDADATAIYGSRGANGVVLITTKKGKTGKTSFDVNIQSGVGKVSNSMKLLNTEQYLDMRREAFTNDGAIPTETNAPDLLLWDQDRYTDWQEELIGGTAYTTDARLSVSGGNERTQFSIRGGYYKETTVFPGDFAYQRMSLQSNINHTSENQKFRVSFSTSFTRGNNNLLNKDLTEFIDLPPNAPDFMTNEGDLLFPNGLTNPFMYLKRKYEQTTKNYISNAVLSYDFWSGFRAKVNLGYTQMWRDEVETQPQNSVDPNTDFAGRSRFADASLQTWIVEPQLEYRKSWNNCTLRILAGATFQENIRENKSLEAIGFTDDALLEDIASASDVTVLGSNYTQYRYHALFGRINYDWKGKYILNLTGRRDGSSRFGPGKQFSNFGAIGAAWIFSEELFIKEVFPFLSYGKLRGSYGLTGNDQIGDYQYLDTFSSTSFSYQGNTGLFPTRLFNPDFAWERNRKLEAALELGFWGDRIRFNAGYYRNRSDNQLISLPLSPSTGFGSIQSNLAALIENTGWELELNTTNMSTHNFTWRTSVNLTIPRNKLLDFPDIASSSYATRYEIGKSLFIWKKFRQTGVDPHTGIYQFEDVNGDGMITSPEDLQPTPPITRDFFGGVNNSFTYKNWNIDVFFQFVKQKGRHYMNYNPPGFMSNQPIGVLHRWQQEGDITNIQRFTQRRGEAGAAYTTARDQGNGVYGDRSFIRLKNVSISYRIPGEKMPFQSGRIYLQGQNLWTITDYFGLDPENTLLPPLRTITMGVQFVL